MRRSKHQTGQRPAQLRQTRQRLRRRATAGLHPPLADGRAVHCSFAAGTQFSNSRQQFAGGGSKILA